MITLAEVLLKSGWTQEQIDALDAKAKTGLTDWATGIETSAAEKERLATEAAVKAEADRKTAEAQAAAAKTAQEAAELAQRSTDDFWKQTYNPGVAAWEAERTKLAKAAADKAAEAAFYKTQRTSYLDTLGIKPEDAPVFTPAAPVVVVPPVTPGTPTFTINDAKNEIGTALGTVANIQWEYQTLYGSPMPISPTALLAQAEANKFKDPATYANQLWKFSEKRAEIAKAKYQSELDAAAKVASDAKDAEWKAKSDAREAEIAAQMRKIAEGQGSNGDVKTPPGSAKFSELQRQQKSGERKDPTRMTLAERRQTSLDNIHKAVEERQQQVA
jgi:hypothetical protein